MNTRLTWRKSSRSGDNGGQCVELADAGRAVAVRDSKNPDQEHLAFSRRQLASFAAMVKRS